MEKRPANLCPKGTKSLQIRDRSSHSHHLWVTLKTGLGLNTKSATSQYNTSFCPDRKEQGHTDPSQVVLLFANTHTHTHRVPKDLHAGLYCNLSSSFNQYRSHRTERVKGAPGPAAELPVLVRPERQSWMRCLHDSEREPPRAAASEAAGGGGGGNQRAPTGGCWLLHAKH